MAKYLDIFENLKAKIENREYKPGEKLPSIRKIADKFSCNKLTVKKAYDKLKEENYIKQLVGKGSFVKFPDSYKNKGKSLDFSSSYISEKFFPVDKMQQIVDNLFKIERTNLFAQSNLKGIKNFRSTLSNYYNVGKKNMIIISGAQQGLDLISKVFNLKINKNIFYFKSCINRPIVNITMSKSCFTICVVLTFECHYSIFSQNSIKMI